MKFKKYLNEVKVTADVMSDEEKIKYKKFVKQIQKECKYYLKLVNDKYLYRGMTGLGTSGKLKTRKNRTPQGTDRQSFKLINDYLEKNGHTRRDNSVIATPD